MDNKWKSLSKKIINKNEFVEYSIEQVQLPNGHIIEYNKFQLHDFVTILCITENKKFLLVNQYRYNWKENIWECPSGGIEKDETPEVAAQREIMEETGYKTISIRLISKLRFSIFSDNFAYIFVAIVQKVGDQSLDEGEDIKFKEFNESEVKTLIENTKFNMIFSLYAWEFREKIC